NQLNQPRGIYVDDDDHSIYIADTGNHRIVRWELGASNGEIVVGEKGQGISIDQLSEPIDVILDKEKKYIIICDYRNFRVIRWSRQNSHAPQVLMRPVFCYGLAMDNNGAIYTSDFSRHQVMRWQEGDAYSGMGTLIAGGHQSGNHFNQLSRPQYIFIDEYGSIYVADNLNNRVMKWLKNANEGILVAPGQVSDENTNSLSRPIGVIVDHMGNIYVTNEGSHRITRWSPSATEAITVVGEQYGSGPTPAMYSQDLSFDQQNNLYVVDTNNDRIQQFIVDGN
ncbi:unnamed protein product, partial [Adineta steineri]